DLPEADDLAVGRRAFAICRIGGGGAEQSGFNERIRIAQISDPLTCIEDTRCLATRQFFVAAHGQRLGALRFVLPKQLVDRRARVGYGNAHSETTAAGQGSPVEDAGGCESQAMTPAASR